MDNVDATEYFSGEELELLEKLKKVAKNEDDNYSGHE